MTEPSALNLERQQVSATTLANAATLVSTVIREIAGNDISDSIGGVRASTDLIENIALQRMTKQIQVTEAA